jgi:peptide/nickel transport system substrate-binding protein
MGAMILACARGESPRDATTLTLAIRADVRGIYPNVGNESFSFGVNSNLFEGLTRLDGALKPQPAAAESWENPDDQTWLFHLRPNLRFSDGSPLRAADVVASILYAGRRQPAPDYFLNHESVEAVSETELRIRTRRPDPLLLANLAPLFILPSAVLSRNPIPPIGTGPYVLEHWSRGRELVLLANRFYSGPRPTFSRVRFVVLPEERDRIQALLDGEVQIVEQLSVEGMARLRERGDVRVVSQQGLRVLFLALRMNERPFSDPRVREALDRALDREELVRRALGGQGTPASQLVPPAVMGYNPSIQPGVPDRQRARELLRAAGYPHGFPIRLDGPNNRYRNDTQILEEVKRQLGEIGIIVEINALPKERFFALQEAFGSRFYLFGWTCETLQAGDALGVLTHTRSPDGMGSENSQFFSDALLDRLIGEASDSGDLSTKADLWRSAIARVAELRPVLPLVIERETFGFSRTILWEPPLDGSLRILEVASAIPASPPAKK